ncbi:amidohydrolase [Dactylonectria estremocensis]|uniref:Amidohydrolase n=1 Tax=Dactylonectria estremocensis TaxID=1079267 RepID=A0A9P9IJW7_9HYPO|nr:amidohydrolase [Dactylonectria estremocensis]
MEMACEKLFFRKMKVRCLYRIDPQLSPSASLVPNNFSSALLLLRLFSPQRRSPYFSTKMMLSNPEPAHLTARSLNDISPSNKSCLRKLSDIAPKKSPKRPTAELRHRIPRGAWDSHMHILDTAAFPLSDRALYRPSRYCLDQAESFQRSVGIDNMVIVQPSIYGFDNSCVLDALRKLGPKRGRAVVSFEPQTVPLSTLQEWHDLGVRAVRVNFSSLCVLPDVESLKALLLRHAEDCKHFGWAIQLFVPMATISAIETFISELPVRVCFDHMGHPSLPDTLTSDPYAIRGFKSLVNLLQGGNTFVKLSAPYRLTSAWDYSRVEPVAKELIRLFGKSRVVFATDWPHTRFEGLDIRPWTEDVLDWCGDDELLVERLFRGNAEDLWMV